MILSEKKEIDRSTLYNFEVPFSLFHADAGNIRGILRAVTDSHSQEIAEGKIK